MQIIVPMSGFGERFKKAGYTVPKPLISVDGKPIIAHVIDLFPGEDNFVFVCNQEHLDTPEFHMRETLEKYCPTGRILGIPSHKLGPVHAVLQASAAIKDDEPVVVNYCDFTCFWDWQDFKGFVAETQCDGAIPAYRGFHPHSLGSTFYAYLQHQSLWASDIQEKTPFTNDPPSEFASSGTYYFASGALMKNYMRETMELGLEVGGEAYVSLVYKPMFRDKKRIAIYGLQHFMQWGTPQDLAEYQRWSALFSSLNKAMPTNLSSKDSRVYSGTCLLPMAGAGSRFAEEGYDLPKPLIPVSAKPMFTQALKCLPKHNHVQLVIRKDLPAIDVIRAGIAREIPEAVITELEGITDGQARTCSLALESERAFAAELPLTIGACDNGAIFNPQKFDAMMNRSDVDVIVWGIRGHPHARLKPNSYGWIDATNDGKIKHVSVKTPLLSPETDPVIVGTFIFKKAKDFLASADRLYSQNGKINGEFYVDSCINDAIDLGLNCWLFEIDFYLGWGTPTDLATFEYWQSCFDKWPSHSYSLSTDPLVPDNTVVALRQRFAATKPERPL